VVEVGDLELDEQGRELTVAGRVFRLCAVLGHEGPQDGGQGDDDQQRYGQLHRAEIVENELHECWFLIDFNIDKLYRIYAGLATVIFYNLTPIKKGGPKAALG
jgi:hypothetical protein